MFEQNFEEVFSIIRPNTIGTMWHQYKAAVSLLKSSTTPEHVSGVVQSLYDLLSVLHKYTAEPLLVQTVDEQERDLIRRAYIIACNEYKAFSDTFASITTSTMACVIDYNNLLRNALAIDETEPRRSYCVFMSNFPALSELQQRFAKNTYIFFSKGGVYQLLYFDKQRSKLISFNVAQETILRLIERLGLSEVREENPVLLSGVNTQHIATAISRGSSLISTEVEVGGLLSTGWLIIYGALRYCDVMIESKALNIAATGLTIGSSLILTGIVGSAIKRAIERYTDVNSYSSRMRFFPEERLHSLKEERQTLLSILVDHEETRASLSPDRECMYTIYSKPCGSGIFPNHGKFSSC